MDAGQLRDVLSVWLLSSDRPPAALAEALTISAITPHPLTAWRFQGMWRREYAGQLGRLRHRQLPQRPDDSDKAVVTEERPSELVLAQVDGEEEVPFDEVVFEGDRPEPPGPDWAALAARRAAAAWQEVVPDPEVWARLGAPHVADVADRVLKRSLGSPDLMGLTIESAETLGALHRAEVVFWEVQGAVSGRPLRCVIGPDGSVWGEPPSEEGAAGLPVPVLLLGAGWTLAALLGLLLLVVPGVLIGAVGALHVRHRLGDQRRRQLAAVAARVERSLASG